MLPWHDALDFVLAHQIVAETEMAATEAFIHLVALAQLAEHFLAAYVLARWRNDVARDILETTLQDQVCVAKAELVLRYVLVIRHAFSCVKSEVVGQVEEEAS